MTRSSRHLTVILLACCLGGPVLADERAYYSYGMRESNWSSEMYVSEEMREAVVFEPGVDNVVQYQSPDFAEFSFDLLAVLRNNKEGDNQLRQLYGVFKKGRWLSKLETGNIKGGFHAVSNTLIQSSGDTFNNDYTFLTIGKESRGRGVLAGIAYLDYAPPTMLRLYYEDVLSPNAEYYISSEIRQQAIGAWFKFDTFKEFVENGPYNDIELSLSFEVIGGLHQYSGFKQARKDLYSAYGTTLNVNEAGGIYPVYISTYALQWMYKTRLLGGVFGFALGIEGRAHQSWASMLDSDIDRPSSPNAVNAAEWDGSQMFYWGPFVQVSGKF